MVKYLDNSNNSGFNQWRAARDASAKKDGRLGWFWWLMIFLAAWWMTSVLMSPRGANIVSENTVASEFVAIDADMGSHVVETDDVTVSVNGLRITDARLAHFPETEDAVVKLLPSETAFAEIGYVSSGTVAPTPNTKWNVDANTQKWRAADGVEYVRVVDADGYVITVSDTIHNPTSHDITVSPYARIVRESDGAASAGVYTGAVVRANNDINHRDWRAVAKKAYAYTTDAGFIGFADQYWETIASIDSPDQTMRIKKSGDKYVADTAAGAVVIAPGGDATINTRLYFGPRERDALRAASKTIPGINKTMDYGWFGFLARPMLWLLNFLNNIVGNYGLAIILMTILLRLILWPLTRKSYTSMAAMQKMQPEMQRIQKLYANDKARLQMEMMRLYSTHKTSPMSGCLPLLIQIPIFFALYKALLISVGMRHAHFLWIHDLATMDPYFILPILMGASMWLQQYLQSGATPKNTNPNDPMAATQRMMKWMPVLFTVMFAWMPAGLVLYWTMSNIFGILQMYIIKKRS